MRSPLPVQADASQTGLLQPIVAGVLAVIVGYASTFALVLAAYAAAGASAAEAGSGLFAICLAVGLLNVAGLWNPFARAGLVAGIAMILLQRSNRPPIVPSAEPSK